MSKKSECLAQRLIFCQPNGKPATIDFIEVGGRTTALVTELQKMPEGVDIKPKISKGGKGSQKRKAKDSDSVSHPCAKFQDHI